MRKKPDSVVLDTVRPIWTIRRILVLNSKKGFFLFSFPIPNNNKYANLDEIRTEFTGMTQNKN